MVFENLFDARCKVGVDLRQPLGQVFMHGAFGDAKLPGDRANRISRFDDIHADLERALLDVVVHGLAPHFLQAC